MLGDKNIANLSGIDEAKYVRALKDALLQQMKEKE